MESAQTYTTQEVADLIGVHKNTVLNWIKGGKVADPTRDHNNARIWTHLQVRKLVALRDGMEQLSLLD